MSLTTNTTIKSPVLPTLPKDLLIANPPATAPAAKPVADTVVRTAVNPLLDWTLPAAVTTPGSAVNTGKLTNLKEKLDGIDTTVVTSAKDRFLTGAFGSA